jgi:retron-type reverse transcriptase
MKRYGNLWGTLISFENLYLAYWKAIRGKRSRKDVAAFIFNAESELLTLQEELCSKTYCPDLYRTFYVYEEKKRMISAAPFRDRVVHHALCNVLEPLFERSFIFDLYSNRKAKGQHQAVQRAQKFARMFPYVLKCDIKKYFPSIDHDIMKRTLCRKIKCKDTLWLTELIIDRSNPQLSVYDYFPGDQLLTPMQRRKGLPIGNQTSQFFANIYLDPLDHFIKETLLVRGYLRYVDDFLLFGHEKNQVWEWKEKIEHFLEKYRLRLKPNGCTLYQVRNGFPFLGYQVLPATILIKRAAILRFRRNVKHVRAKRRAGKINLDQVKCFVFGCMGHFAQASTEQLREKLLEEAWF